MEKTYWQSRLRSGSSLSEGADVGDVLLTQTTTVTTVTGGTAVSSTLTLPASAQIVDFHVDTMTTPVVGGSGTATTCPITVGTAAAGEQYMSSTNMIATGRAAPTLSAAQLSAMASIGSSTSMVITVDPNGTVVTTQGVFRLTVTYALKA